MKFLRDFAPVVLLVAMFTGFFTVSIQAYADINNYEHTSSPSLFAKQVSDISINTLVTSTSSKPTVVATKSARTEKKPVETAISQDVSAPLSLPTPVTIPTASVNPYSLNGDSSAQLSDLGYSLPDLQADGIQVLGHSGAVPRRCATGSSGGLYAQGMAILTDVTYTPCPNGQSPLYDAYRPAGYDCTVIYNSRSAKSTAVLAHEVAHCLHFTHGQYRAFDVKYRTIRPAASALDRGQMNEVIADDYMICKHSLDTNFGASSYYTRYGVSRPTADQCKQINNIIDLYLL